MVAVPIPLPPPPVVRPGDWDPSAPDPLGGPTVGQVWGRIKQALGVTPDTQATPRVDTHETDCSQTSNQNQCNRCKLGQGVMVPANYTIGLRQYANFDYQLQIANLAAAPERFGYTFGGSALDRARLRLLGGKNEITLSEWNYQGVGFDGFWRGQCTAVEAKAEYAQFFTDDAEPRWPFVQKKIIGGWVEQKNRQRRLVTQAGAPSRLQWHFKYRSCFIAAVRAFRADAALCRYTP
ncbi:Tox-REase-5 domain-containing protein [Xanthomonas maliensis]|uniref:Tox-REase-5 domain-containing protein n=1 Tax=Xanthomonas maliensis TaxID=1321368 RepID=UPI00039B1963|nr:Tox-REase-5 domain-containing protein [Xanthomonas maliensis]KAB7763254.1 hypothetical protein CKY51_20085 [Xanthomonas maliensis]